MQRENKQALMAIKRLVGFGIYAQIHRDESQDVEYTDSLKILSLALERIEKKYGLLDGSIH